MSENTEKVMMARVGEVTKLEPVAPPEFGGDLATLERMLVDAVEGPHAEWTPKDLEDIARRVRANRERNIRPRVVDNAISLQRSD